MSPVTLNWRVTLNIILLDCCSQFSEMSSMFTVSLIEFFQANQKQTYRKRKSLNVLEINTWEYHFTTLHTITRIRMKISFGKEITRVKAQQLQSLHCIVWLTNDNSDKEIFDCYKQVLVPFYCRAKIKCCAFVPSATRATRGMIKSVIVSDVPSRQY